MAEGMKLGRMKLVLDKKNLGASLRRHLEEALYQTEFPVPRMSDTKIVSDPCASSRARKRSPGN